MSLEEATRALRDEGAMDPQRKRALRDRVLAAPRKRPTRALRWAMPIAAVLVGASVWASVSRQHAEVTPVAPTTTTTTTVAAMIAPPVASIVTASAEVAVVKRAAPRAIASATNDAEKRALRAYREAERLQFEEKDYRRALDAWDRYLPIAGASPLVVDARYDRALCLYHLGRRDEARAALEPF